MVGKSSATELYPGTSFGFNLKMFFENLFLDVLSVRGLCAHKCRCLQSPEGCARSPGVGIRGRCESPYVDAGKGIRPSASSVN